MDRRRDNIKKGKRNWKKGFFVDIQKKKEKEKREEEKYDDFAI